VIDKIQIQQVLLNLVRNATDAMSPRGHGKLSIVVRRADNMAEISVTDDGPGLSESVRSKLFQPFVTSKPTGMGVGLSVCRTIVEAHGGKIWAEDARSGGVVFRFTVPVPETGQDESRPA
jgi:two-component system sensor kinase FixL